jgi:hypothetical protein
MRPIKTTCLCLLAAFLLSGCQLFEPLPTLPPVLTLPPVDLQASPQAAQATPASSPVLQASATLAEIAPTVALPASPTSAPPTRTPTSQPSATSRPTNPPPPTAENPAPTSADLAAWNGVPIMPGATDAKEENGSYSYIINARITDVQAYYDRMMPLAGWQPFATGEGEAGNLLLMYQKDNVTATIGVINQDGSTLVLIVAE